MATSHTHATPEVQYDADKYHLGSPFVSSTYASPSNEGSHDSYGSFKLIRSPEAQKSGRPAWVELPAGKSNVNVHVDFAYPPSGLPYDWLVFWIYDPDDTTGKRSVPDSRYALRNIPRGNHNIVAMLVNAVRAPGSTEVARYPPRIQEALYDTDQYVILCRSEVPTTVRPAEAFEPTYENQTVEPWHRLPPGLEIFMDVNTGAKHAKISEPWQLNLLVKEKDGEDDMVRVMVKRTTTVEEIIQEANRARAPRSRSSGTSRSGSALRSLFIENAPSAKGSTAEDLSLWERQRHVIGIAEEGGDEL